MPHAVPLVTVLMPVYNGEKYLREAIESILNQTFTDFEFLIINDGSTDHTEEIILSYNDERIKYVKNETNLRLIATLNKGLDLAKGKYIARMDADDISLPERLEKQVAFMEFNHSIGVLGTWVTTSGLDKNYDILFKKGVANIRFELFFHNYLHHPTVMLRSEVLRKSALYYDDFLHAEDYAFWIKLATHTQIDIYPEILLKYRLHNSNISEVHKDFQLQQTSEIRKLQLLSLGINPSAATFEIYEKFIDTGAIGHPQHFKSLMPLLEEIVVQNKSNQLLDEELLFNYFRKKVTDYLELNCWKMGKEINFFYHSVFSNSIQQNFKFCIKQKLKLKGLWN